MANLNYKMQAHVWECKENKEELERYNCLLRIFWKSDWLSKATEEDWLSRLRQSLGYWCIKIYTNVVITKWKCKQWKNIALNHENKYQKSWTIVSMTNGSGSAW